MRWGDQWYSFPILGPDININPQEAEAFTQDGKNQPQMLPAARRTMFGRNGRYSNEYAVFTFTYLIKPTLRRISGQCRTSSSTFWMKCTKALSQPRLSTVCSEIYTSSLPPSPAFSYLSSNDVSADGLLSFNGEHGSLNEQCVASHSPKATSSCDGRGAVKGYFGQN